MNARESESEGKSNIVHGEKGITKFSEVRVGQIFQDLDSGVVGIRTKVMHISVFSVRGSIDHAINAVNLRTGIPFLLDQNNEISLLASLAIRAI